MEPVLLAALAESYIRRRRFIARLQAVEAIRAQAEAMGHGPGPAPAGGSSQPQYEGKYRKVPSNQLLARMGVRWG